MTMTSKCTPAIALKHLRSVMDWTQAEAASFLGISKKAIESYEQGWRNVPENLWKGLLTLVAVQKNYPRRFKRCWEIMGCEPGLRKTCFCCEKMDGKFCWMTATTNCHVNHPELKKGLMTCLCCPVVHQFLPCPSTTAKVPAGARAARPRRAAR
jgi:DNA-binding XRE family transcriptional regulator